MKIGLCFFCLLTLIVPINAQLKFLIEDFEGLKDGTSDLKSNGLFTFGNTTAFIHNTKDEHAYSGQRLLQVEKNGKVAFGGWGKGIGLYVNLDYKLDYLNFYVCQPASNTSSKIKLELQEDDNQDHIYQKEMDDTWTCLEKLENKNVWKLISIPLSRFTDANPGGDGVFNVNYKQGKLLCLIISFVDANKSDTKQVWLFDFICFSKGKLPEGTKIFDAPMAAKDDACNLGVWSSEGNTANFLDIAKGFENNFKLSSVKKLGIVHFFQPFSVEGGNTQYHYPSVEKINEVIENGYIPMITLEDHFVNTNSKTKQPNLYSIVEGHFDSFFGYWAHQIKQVKGTVLLRMMHEFNGDWYPWCTVKNDKNPDLVAKAYRYIYHIFKENQVTNVKFIWCPNSMSVPQENWNDIMDAYPGDEYVDMVALDVYNGAGNEATLWRSFRKECIGNYFILTQQLPSKPLFICETASRERKGNETGQNKSEWIKQMSIALKTDMSNIRLLTWFDEKETFKINSSSESKNAYINYILKDDYFKSGTKYMYPILFHKERK